jgi:hypothetical protein
VAFRRIRDIPPCVVALAWWPEHTSKVADLVTIATGFRSAEKATHIGGPTTAGD